MLKKSLFLSFLGLLLFCGYAQPQTFTFTRVSPQYVDSPATTMDITSYGAVINQTTSAFSVRYIRTTVNVPSGWETAICTPHICYPPFVDTSQNENLPPLAHDTMSAHFYPYGYNGQGTFIVRVERIGSSEFHEQTFGAIAHPVGIIQISTIAKEFSLEQNYPNPFNPFTKINFSIPVREAVYLRVYDILGREVKTLVNEQLGPGEYEYDFEADNMTSGFYYYSLRAGEYVSVKKMVLVK